MSTKVKSPEKLPKKPGIYIMKDSGDNIIYIGKSKSLRNRVKSYFKDKYDTPKTKILMSHFNSLEYIITDSEKEALILEANLIKKHRPKYNIRLKDDKRYPYVKITKEDFPRLIITRNIGKTGTYFGPFTDVGSVRQTVKFLKSLFKIRTCRKMDGPCLNCQIDLCYGPCSGNISKNEYKKLINKIDLFFQGKYTEIIENLQKEMEESSKEYNFEKAAVIRDQIASIAEVMEKQFVDFTDELDQDIIAMSFDGNSAIVVVFSIRNGKINGKDDFLMSGAKNNKPSEVISAFIEQYYSINRHIPKEIILEEKISNNDELKLIKEWLADLRGDNVEITVPDEGTKLRLIRMASKNAEIIKKQKKKMKNAMIEIKKYLKLPKLPRIIEGYDVSNISGKLAVGSKVSFLDSKPNKKQYKRFKLETPGPNDYEMMRELLSRRFKKLSEKNDNKNKDNRFDEEYPDLILIDGGKGQLGIATEVLKEYNLEHIPIIGLAKEFEEVFIPQSSYPIIIPKNNEGLHLLQRVRDEAHRFAVTYHRKLRSKNIETSELDNIVGIGKTRKINLLKHFGDIEKIKKASVEEITSVKGLNKKVAEAVYNKFN
ncbi:excinuclease ABC subunit C [Methanobrevibacter arboriphilus]|jgi:excinuclease ABC subunit C|uniref:Excinuclease ABC subunit C n=1 Tax=Methanobrevibacter arboriphilus TaxID=39441 RepID=A0ACA8R0X3_METAZ|nr:excinuclease ABC subunit UvrC [Methanobrevibacter arboriphilus]BBL61165.1 excinuclease ABC subunit C [Methanobrevibacter arboriphilus]GLI12240.1 excinuclease ABC subunit C [Methanobrevibacter arboriphilus]